MKAIILVTKVWRGGRIFRKMGRRMRVRMMAMVLPIVVSLIAWFAFPWSKKWWPGKTDRAVSSEGAPRNMEGMKSRRVWAMAMAVMNMIRVVIGRGYASGMTMAAMRLIWIPGMRPVIVPARIPARKIRI